MIKVERFVCNMIRENCYVVSDETLDCAIIDCGAYYPEERTAIKQYTERNGLHPTHLLVTHGHIDHNFGNPFVFETYGLQPEVHGADEDLMNHLAEQAEALCGVKLSEKMPPVGRYLDSDDTISVGNHQFSIIATPGHTPGGVFFYCRDEHLAFSGDTLFHNSVGRTDFQGGSRFMLIQSLRMISQLPDETIVMPGHGEQTTIGIEVEENPFLDR
jgi:hydroxyacylglutathione hydrolase